MIEEDECPEDGIPLPNVTSTTLFKAEIFHLILAANFLNIAGLLNLTCQKAATDILNSNRLKEYRTMVNIKNDFTPRRRTPGNSNTSDLDRRREIMGCGVQLLLLFLNLLISHSTGKNNGVCISPGGRFPPFSSEGKPPRKVNKGPKDLTLCRVFRRNTCCDVTQTHQALLSIRRLDSVGEADQECLQLWELLECSICDPRVGVQRGPPLICSSLCDRIFQSCSSAYFSMDAKTQVLSPCGLSDFVCGRASEWVSNGTELCQHAGFAVKSSGNGHKSMEEPSCYGGKASLDSVADSWKSSHSRMPYLNNCFSITTKL
ncbi:folate receptor family protein [Thalictrum thalictroides]|uniref:Folate receptor family protein n=1 Tax=Thalictrum thalictroides TaxID=46969 RepID=A0A7J6V7I5_THATH|nr:folate receptor family protein [Thalictrum thalictroides]